MKNKIKTLATLLLLCLFALSCNNNGNNNEDKKDSVVDNMNDHIQDTFFDTTFGVSKEELIDNFKKHDFLVDSRFSTEEDLHFSYKKGNRFSFGGLSWEMLSACIINNKFCLIRFYSSSNDKASALDEFDRIYNAVSKKYKLENIEESDTTKYKVAIGKDKNNNRIRIYCRRAETFMKDMVIYTELYYDNDSLSNAVNDEL